NNRPDRGPTLASRSELSAFLESVERRAFKQAVFAVRDEEAALDIVQDAMLRLAEKYGHRPAEELPLLFHRIVQNAIRDWFRRQKVRSLWTTLLSSLSPSRGEDDEQDPLETLQPADGSNVEEAPAEQLERAQVLEIIEQELARLPARQREAFVMRYWEELDVAETARVMGCPAGNMVGDFGGWTGVSLRVLVPVAMLLIGFGAIYTWQQNQRAAEVEEIDAQLLTGDLPIDAYLDRGFQNYLKTRAAEE